MDETVETVAKAAAALRRRHAETLARVPQAEIVAALSALGERWRDPGYHLRREAETWTEPFPFAMVQVSLEALLSSLTPEALWALIDAETVRGAVGYPVAGHVVAGNTPLLAWVTILRALLVRSGSLVKLPSNAAARWAYVFQKSLTEIAPLLAENVYLAQWPGGTRDLDAALCAHADLVLAHGSDAALADLRALCPPGTPFVGYGHRVSFGLTLPGADWDAAAQGFARDILVYDQGGCLSPQVLYIVGEFADAERFAAMLADALAETALRFPLPVRAASAAGAVAEARALAFMEDGAAVWSDDSRRWTVIARPESKFRGSPTFGVVSVQPLAAPADLPEALASVAGRVQGCAVAGTAESYLPGVPYLCAPGAMQAPPLAWRQDGRDVLRVLLPPAPQLTSETRLNGFAPPFFCRTPDNL